MVDWEQFERCRDWIRDALEYNMTGQTLDDVKTGLAEGEYVLWPGENCAIVTEHFDGPRGKFTNLFLAGGDLGELPVILQRIEDRAKQDGVRTITLYGRRGWERSFLRDVGYRPLWTVMTKEIAP